MPENITTVLNLPDADFGSGGFPSPADNRAYILQGEGSDRDRKVSLGDLFDWLVGAKAMTNDSPQHRVGDIVFKIEETQGGKILTAYIMDGRTLSKPTVTGGLKADSIEGTNQGQGDTKYLVLGNTTVTGDLDVKGKAMLGNSMLVADPDEQTLESRVPLGFGDGYQAGKELVRTDEVKTAKISAPGMTLVVTAWLAALGVEGNVKTDSIAPTTAGRPISVTGDLSISGNVTLTGAIAAVSAKSVATERLSCSKLSLKDNGMAYAPALPYFVDTAYAYDGDLSRYCAGAPSGGRVTFVNATGSDRKYTFTGGANGKSGYFTLKNGRAVDLLVFKTLSSTQTSLVPIGIDFSTGG
nr:MAG TPA: hypothetical protein [Caudoviricetes sp.]